MFITAPKAELLRKTGGLLEKQGYEVRVFDLINPDTSFCYNPFEYVHDDKDVLRLISNLIQNTTPKGSQSSDPFWEKSETALLQALMLYLLHEAPPEEQNFETLIEMINSSECREDDETFQNAIDRLFAFIECWINDDFPNDLQAGGRKDRQVHPDQCRCPSGSLQPAADRQTDQYR